MSRVRLGSLLVEQDVDDARGLCAAEVAEGRPYRIFGEHPLPEALTTIYARRVEHVSSRGVASVGADGLVERLSAERSLAVGAVEGSAYHFVIFFDGDLIRCVACWGVPVDYPGALADTSPPPPPLFVTVPVVEDIERAGAPDLYRVVLREAGGEARSALFRVTKGGAAPDWDIFYWWPGDAASIQGVISQITSFHRAASNNSA